ncbi:MAG: DUF938 domain-containing protein [Verrucomicrobia bacterium]|nr:DUF938 domain-containing protein [Verrucomicrobiota bacterium]
MAYNLTASTSAAQRNREPICDQLRVLFAGVASVLELGSGCGEHARYLSENLPHVKWQPSEQPSQFESLSTLNPTGKLLPPIELDMAGDVWPSGPYDAVFLVNVLHMFPEPRIPKLLRRIAGCLSERGLFVAYGPFNLNGAYTGPGNEAFDHMIRQQNERCGLRDISDLQQWGKAAGLIMRPPIPMPADNRLLVWDGA